ncbi:MAG: tRNA (adenosine(37)-N6)-threonylcarbamoyltransferase complex ATPase subunit type 1 TsaE [Patescibacteria group bacterium]
MVKRYDTDMQYVSQSTQDTQAIAAKLAQKIRAKMPLAGATIVALRGDLGAGKTTFTQGFANALGITQQPKSPTFMLAKQYAIPGTPYSLWHLDCYRLQSHKDLAALDLHALFIDANNIMLIEWPENIGDGLPRDRIEVHFEHAGNDKRSITISES